MSTLKPSLLAIVGLATFSSTSAISDTLLGSSTQSTVPKSNLDYHPAESDYPPITPYPPSAKLPASSKFWFEDENLKMPILDHGRIYGENPLAQTNIPTCRLTSCYGTYSNDGNSLVRKETNASNEGCKHVFLQMNGCAAQKGYPIGIVCTICCQCSKQSTNEMSHHRNFLTTDWLTRRKFTFI